MGCGSSTAVLVSPNNDKSTPNIPSPQAIPIVTNPNQQNVDCKTTNSKYRRSDGDGTVEEEVILLEENVNIDESSLVLETNFPTDDPEIGISKNEILQQQQEAVVNNSRQTINEILSSDANVNAESSATKQHEQPDKNVNKKSEFNKLTHKKTANDHAGNAGNVMTPNELPLEQNILAETSKHSVKMPTDHEHNDTILNKKPEPDTKEKSSETANKSEQSDVYPVVPSANDVDVKPNNGSRCSHYSSDSSFVDMDAAENLLSGIVVNDVIASLTAEPATNASCYNEQQDKGEDANITKAVPLNNRVDASGLTSEDKINPNLSSNEVEQSGPIIAPSSGPTPAHKPVLEYCDTEGDIKLHSAMRFACNVTDNQQLVTLAADSNALYLERSLPEIAEIVAAMPMLRKLDISGNHSGPVSVRAILTILSMHDCVECLNLSDNMADAECAEHLGKYISSSKNLKWLNVASNNFGKESLNRCLSTSVSSSESLTYLDISGCGAMNVHGLLEAMRQGYSNATLPLSYLNISSNHVNDGQQLGIDLSLVLENPNCCLASLNLNSTGLNAAGWDALVSGVQANSSLNELNIGGSQNCTTNLNSLVKMIAAANTLDKLILGGVKIKDEQAFTDETLPPLNLKDLDINNCGLVDEVFVKLAKSSPGCLGRLEMLNLTGNVEISSAGLEAIDIICSKGTSSNVKSLNLSLLEVEYLPSLLANCFQNLTNLNIRKSRITPASLTNLSTIPQTLSHLSMDGIKLSNTGVLSAILGSDSKHQFQTLGLGNCGITDADAKPISEAFGRVCAPLHNLFSLDLSSNRLTDVALMSIDEQLIKAQSHPLKVLDVANNAIKDDGAEALSKLTMSASSASNMQVVSIANNHLTCPGITSLVNAFKSGTAERGLVSLDASNQKNGLDDDEANDVLTNLATTLGVDIESSDEPIPVLPVKLIVNLTNLGGAVGFAVKALNSIAIKTDFGKICQDSANLADFLSVGAGLEKNMGLNTTEKMCTSFTSAEWSGIVGSDAPAWLKVAEERQKGVYINQLPGTATVQRLEGMLEMEADCQVCDVYIVKDPIMRKPTGAAWVLFATEDCVQKVVDWFLDGEAVMYGAAFSVSRLPVVVVDEQQGAQNLAKRDLIIRERQRKENELKDQKMLEESQKLADERAAYREAHPAYQGGRIW